MSLSKTKYVDGMQCKKLLWLLKNKPDEMGELDNNAAIDNGKLVHDMARNIFEDHTLIEYNDNLSVMIDNTKKAMEEDGVICEASFEYNNNFCSVDILVKNGNDVKVYEVKGSTEVKDVYLVDLSYQVYILKQLGYNVTKASIITLNPNYVRNGELDLDELYNINDVTKEVMELEDEVEDNIDEINKFLENGKESDINLDNHCFKPYTCPYFKYCTKQLPKNNVFEIRGMYKRDKIKYYKQGLIKYEDLLKNSKVNNKYKQQMKHELNDIEPEINYEKIKEFLDTLSFPLYFLDFETFSSPIPLYDGTSPYEQIPFQYSLHFVENDELFHEEYLAPAGIDPRRELAERLVRDIPEDVCVLAYNMSFEKGIIAKLAKQFPDLSNHLMNIHDNIKDLMIPFKNRDYYTKDMHGSYSIKYVLPALFPDDEELNYQALEYIHNGSEAMVSYINLSFLPKEEQEYIRERLLRYCELDTYAMVKIIEKLMGREFIRKLVKKR